MQNLTCLGREHLMGIEPEQPSSSRLKWDEEKRNRTMIMRLKSRTDTNHASTAICDMISPLRGGVRKMRR